MGRLARADRAESPRQYRRHRLIAVLHLSTAVAQPSLGRLVDLFGPRRVYLASFPLVAAAGIFGLLAPSLVGLVAVRVLAGVGTSGAYPAAMRIFRERVAATASEPPRFVMGILTLAALSTTAVGPVIGGVLTSAFGWRSIFTVNVPLAFFAVLLILLGRRAIGCQQAASPGCWNTSISSASRCSPSSC
jgi:MFS family permease